MRSSKHPPRGAGATAARWSLIVLAGCAALLFGALGGVALAAPGAQRTAAVAAGVMSLLWAGVRLLLMQFIGRGDRAEERPAIGGAWALGSLIWLIGVTPELRALAWGVSGVLTWLALERTGTIRRRALRIVGIAWGSQATVVAVSWLARNALMAVLLSPG